MYSARYNPLLVQQAGLDLDYIWPASHCASYMASHCGLPRKKKAELFLNCQDDIPDGPLHQAVAAFRAASLVSSAQIVAILLDSYGQP